MTAIKQSIEVLTILTGKRNSALWPLRKAGHVALSLSTDAEKDHISKYMARAFDKTDPGSWLATGQMVIFQTLAVCAYTADM